MKVAFRIFSLLPVVAIAVTVAVGAIIRDRPTASSNGSDITVRWSTMDENGVIRFEVLRSSTLDGPFFAVGTVEPKGSYSQYEYVDHSVFKVDGGLYRYKIRIVDGENPAPESDIVIVSHVSSAAKRTWGSIKAMFR